MTREEYVKWSRRHAAMFGLESEQNAETFAAWHDVFAAANYAADELREATDWLAANDPPRYRSEHLAAIQRRVRDRRQERAAAEAREEVSFPDCELCGGCGWVGFPDPRRVRGGVWEPPQTCAVLCRCPWGQRERRRHDGAKKRPATLEAYERLVPGWRDLLEARRRLQLADARAHQTTAAADRLLGPVLARIRRQMREPVPAVEYDPGQREPGVEDEDEDDEEIAF